MKSNNAELHFKGRAIQVPINSEQEHEFQWTVLNDASGTIYTTLRSMMVYDYDENRRMLNNGYTVTVKARGDQTNNGGMDIVLRGVRVTGVGALDFSHTDPSIQTFTVDGYADFTDFRTSSVKKDEGILGKVDKISGKISNILGM